MKFQVFVIFIVISVRINATSYRRGADLDPNEVELLFQEDTPSQINCAIRCSIKKGDFVYNEGKCICFLYLSDKTKKSGIHPKTLTGIFYEKQNICLTGNGGCHPDAKCNNNIGTNGAISCTCNPGYIGNGLSCTDVNECLLNNGDCDTNANCTNTIGSRTCICKKGYKGNGSTCTAPCQKSNTVMLGHRIAYFNHVKTWQQCARKCVDKTECIILAWRNPYWKTDKCFESEKCFVFSSHTRTFPEDNVISGVRGCVT